jgi:hypothetical protein
VRQRLYGSSEGVNENGTNDTELVLTIYFQKLTITIEQGRKYLSE